MKQCYIKAKCRETDRDVSEIISTMRFEDCTDKTSKVEFGIFETYALTALDSEDWKKHNTIEFQFGFLGGSVSDVHVAEIKDIDATYNASVKVTVNCLDKGHSARRGGVQTIWVGKKASEIAKEIAAKHGLQSVIDETTVVYKNLPQAGASDYEFMRELAGKETAGSHQFYVRGETLYFVKKDLAKSAQLTISRGDEDFIEFKPQTRDTSKSTSADGVKLVGVDSFNKEVKVDMVGMDGLTDDANLGDLIAKVKDMMITAGVTDVPELPAIPAATALATAGETTYDAGGKQVQGDPTKMRGLADLVEQKPYLNQEEYKLLMFPCADYTPKDEPTNKANKIVKDGNEKENKGTIKLDGNPTLTPDQVITVKNVAAVHSGNWWVEKVEHTMDFESNGYTVTLELLRKKGVGKVNTTQSDTKTMDDNTAKPIAAGSYDTNGNFVPEVTGGGFSGIYVPGIYVPKTNYVKL